MTWLNFTQYKLVCQQRCMECWSLQEIERRLLGSREGSSRHGRSSCGAPSTPGKESSGSQSASPHSSAASGSSDSRDAGNLSSSSQHTKESLDDRGGEGK